MKPKVVILLSDKRSGSTMFQGELCRHPQIRTVDYSPHTYLETHWWLMGAVLLNRPPRLYDNGQVYPGYGSSKNARSYMVDLLSKCVPAFEPPTDDRKLVMDGWDALCRAYATPVFFEKSPQYLTQWSALSLMLEWAAETDFDVRYVGLVRNPHGMIYSAAELFGTDPSERQFGWLSGCRNLIAFESMVPQDKYLRLRYDEIVNAPQETFGQVLSFLGVEPSDEIGKGVRAGSDNKWVTDSEYRMGLDPAIIQMARTLGFSPEDLELPEGRTAKEGPMIAPTFRRRTELFGKKIKDRFVRPMLMRLR